MSTRDPLAFMSYVRSDDDHDDGRITAFRERLEGEIRMQTGRPFAIFQDRNDIAWGQHWEERINKSLSDVTFLIPILTPSFFQSHACRSEFQAFSLKENMLGVNRLILPLYYVNCDELTDTYKKGTDVVVDVVRSRNWTDWRDFRFKSFADEEVAAALAGMAAMVKASVKELNAIAVAAKGKTGAVPKSQESQKRLLPGLPEILPEAEILEAQEIVASKQAQISQLSVPSAIGGPDAGVGPDSYRVFTNKFDEIIEAGGLAEPAELLKLYKYVSSFSNALKKIYSPALEKMLGDFKRTSKEAPLAVSILIDNSGSMRGRKIIHTAAWCLLIIDWMDRLSIPTEVLGYTTRAWKGGQSRESWLVAGKPANPGRLNDLRYLIYKSFSASAATAAPNFGAMAREGLLKENIDGEALLWAASRLQEQVAENKILYVLSDGAPVDDSTLSVNPENYLELHLRKIIKEFTPGIGLYALGIEHDVSRYYPAAVTLDDVSYLGMRFFETLIKDQGFLSGWKLREKATLVHRPVKK